MANSIYDTGLQGIMVVVFIITVIGSFIDCVAGVNEEGVGRQKLNREERGEGTRAISAALFALHPPISMQSDFINF